jgi:hypothetical protein
VETPSIYNGVARRGGEVGAYGYYRVACNEDIKGILRRDSSAMDVDASDKGLPPEQGTPDKKKREIAH